MSGLPAPNPDTRNFSRKVSYEYSKASPKIKWCVRWEILLHTFLIRKVCSLHTFLRKKGVFTTFFCIKTHLQVKLIIVTFLLTGKSEYIFAPQKALFSSNLRKISKLKRNKKFHKNTPKRILHKNRRRVFSLLPFYL